MSVNDSDPGRPNRRFHMADFVPRCIQLGPIRIQMPARRWAVGPCARPSVLGRHAEGWNCSVGESVRNWRMFIVTSRAEKLNARLGGLYPFCEGLYLRLEHQYMDAFPDIAIAGSFGDCGDWFGFKPLEHATG